MGNRGKAVLISRQTYWGEREFLVSTLPLAAALYTDCHQREVGLMGAVRRFNDGQAVYVNGMRMAKAGAA